MPAPFVVNYSLKNLVGLLSCQTAGRDCREEGGLDCQSEEYRKNTLLRPPAADAEQGKAVLVFLNTKGNGEKKAGKSAGGSRHPEKSGLIMPFPAP